MAFCSNCGAEIPEGAGFCGNCGAPVAVPQAKPDEAQNNEQVNMEPVNRRAYVPQAPQAPQAYRTPRAPVAPRNAAPAPKNQKTLRITSLVFAVAFLLFSIGLFGIIYTGRVVGGYVNDINDQVDAKAAQYREWGYSESGIQDMKISGAKKSALIDATAATAHGDAKGLYAAALKAYRAQNPGYKDDAYYQTLVKVTPSKEAVKSLNESIREATKGMHDLYGFRWTMLTLGSHYSFFMWFGGIVAAISLALWIVQGGRLNNFLQTTVWPALALSCALALTFFILGLALNADMPKLMENIVGNRVI